VAIWDIEEDVNDFFDENLAQAKENKYLKDVDAALNLISKIVPLSDGNKDFKNKIKKLDELNTSLLSAFRTVKLDNEAQLQIKLLQLSSKFKEEQKYKAIENKPIIGIGGKFSSGKSKFINSILNSGEELLPEDQMPTTSIPTYIMYGEREEISAYISENKKVDLDNDALHSLTHKFYEKYKIGFSAFINCLIIYEPKLPYKDVVFLDTPGYSKADFGNKDNKQDDFSDENKAYLQLRAADYLIWLVDIENGVLSETDISFITKVGLNTTVLIVVNKSDKKLDKDIEAVTKSIEQAALDAGLNVFAVTAYSSRNNVEWQERGKISEFLNMIGNKKSCRKDAYNQILEIGSSAVQYVEEKIEISVSERNFLSELILNSEDIMEIKSLIEIYGESMEEIRSMRKSIKKYENVIKGLKDIR
jgi:hypothetical protein